MSPRSLARLAALFVLALTQGCTWTYLEYPAGVGPMGPAKFVVSAGHDTGPEADTVPFVHPQLIELCFEQPESNLANYYLVVLRRARSGDRLAAGDVNSLMGNLKLVARQDEIAAWNALEEGWDEEKGKLVARALARAVGRYVAPAVIWSIHDHGYARVSWGFKTDEGLSGLTLAGNTVYVTVNEGTQELQVHGTAPHSFFALPRVATFSLAAADPEWVLEPRDKDGNPIAIGEYEPNIARVCAEVRRLRDEDLAAVSRIN